MGAVIPKDAVRSDVSLSEGRQALFVALSDRARRKQAKVTKLKRARARLFSGCWILGDKRLGPEDLEARSGFVATCFALVDKLDELIEKAERDAEALAAPGSSSCGVIAARLQGTKKNRLRLTRLAKADPKLLVRVSRKHSEEGTKITIRTRSKRTSLRDAFGKKLTLRLFTPSTAAAPEPGEKIAVTFTFSGKVKKR